MFESETLREVMSVADFMATLFIIVVGIAILFLIGVAIVDLTQRKHAIRHNYPVIGHLRYFFESLGHFFRQYFFALDHEELPFNRAQRTWIYRASKDVDSTLAFGSTAPLGEPGTVYFVNCPFPHLDEDTAEPGPVTIGPFCDKPYTTASLFNISGMSYGAISKPAVIALSNGARMAGAWLNTGEGGLSPFHLEGGADIVFQIGTAKYGVRDEHGGLSDEKLRQVAQHEQLRMFEIKLSQGAKPGKGGILPGVKVSEEIAAIRGIKPGEDSISPNRHPETETVGDILDMVDRIRRATGKPVGFKTVIGAYGWLEELCQEVVKRGPESAPDFITVDSADGGTGAAPKPLMDYVGMPIRESLPLAVDIRNRYGLKDRIRIIASGKLVNPSDVAWALCAGADFVASARGFMFSLGCIQALKCNKNTCPTGITTHQPRLQAGLDPEDKAVRVAQYIKNMVHEVGIIAHSCGVPEPRRLKRFHARIVCEDGRSRPLDEIYPNEGLQQQAAE